MAFISEFYVCDDSSQANILPEQQSGIEVTTDTRINYKNSRADGKALDFEDGPITSPSTLRMRSQSLYNCLADSRKWRVSDHP